MSIGNFRIFCHRSTTVLEFAIIPYLSPGFNDQQNFCSRDHEHRWKYILVLLMAYESLNCPTAATKLIRIINELITWSKSHILKNLLGNPSAKFQNIDIWESRNRIKARLSVFILFAICGSSTVEPTLAEMRHFRKSRTGANITKNWQIKFCRGQKGRF